MPTLTRTKKPDPATLYVALTSGICKAGNVREGDKLRGDHACVQAVPAWFAPADLPTDELYAARKALAGPKRDPEPEMPPMSSDGTPLLVSGPPTDPTGFVVAIADVPPTAAFGKAFSAIRAGTLVSKASPVVKARPKSFRPATLADLPAHM